MQDLKEKASDLLEHAEDIAETYYKLAVLNVTEKASSVASSTLVMMLSAILGLLILFFLGIALSWWLGDMVGNRAAGFLIAAGIFMLLLAILWWARKRIIFPKIRNSIIRKVYEQHD